MTTFAFGGTAYGFKIKNHHCDGKLIKNGKRDAHCSKCKRIIIGVAVDVASAPKAVAGCSKSTRGVLP